MSRAQSPVQDPEADPSQKGRVRRLTRCARRRNPRCKMVKSSSVPVSTAASTAASSAASAVSAAADPASARPRPVTVANEFIIQGVNAEGKTFRPSDWAERLCGVMACFRPEGSGGPNAHLKYSPYVRPTILDGIRSVVVNEELRGLQPLAWHFVMDFARDNDLRIVEACILPDADSR
ncbi:MAG: hypothetical protein JWR22_2507 [Herminiimonas sp.]|nr:hypothetical protein [Herminiimonas sp.]